MLEKLKAEVLQANKMLEVRHLVVLTWGNVSGIDRESSRVVIKASGVGYGEMTTGDLVVTNLDGNLVEDSLRPSTDLDTHLELYRRFPSVGGIVHTHSAYATLWAQAGRSIPCYGTTHADYFPGDIPCTRAMTDEEILGSFERNTGVVIADTFRDIDPAIMRAVLVQCHGPFVWGASPLDAVHNAVVLESVAKMALYTNLLMGGKPPMVSGSLLRRHYDRKFGEDAYYGQI